MDTSFFFHGWEPLERIVCVGLCSYVALIAMLRAAGKRSLSRMNVYDFIITMAVGSILAKIILDKGISLSESIGASALLISMQYLMEWISVRCRWFHRLVTPEPAILFYEGRFNDSRMKRERISHHDITAALHQNGLTDTELVDSIILGSNGQLNVVLRVA